MTKRREREDRYTRVLCASCSQFFQLPKICLGLSNWNVCPECLGKESLATLRVLNARGITCMGVAPPIMRAIKVTFADGTVINTDINGTDEEIHRYYMAPGQVFNVGHLTDNVQRAVKVEFLRPPHTCAGMHDLSCEACWADKEREDGLRDELPGESRYAGDYEPDERDVVGGL